jgi:hypothetical protein
MQEIKIAKLLSRHGSKAMLPQPLSPGEFGVVDDTKEVYVGIDPTSNTGSFLPIIDAYHFANANEHATQVIQTYIFQINLTNPNITIEDIELINDINQTNGFYRLVKKVGNRAYVGYEFKYVSSVLMIPQLPNMGIGTESTVAVATNMDFESYTFDLSGLSYTWEDTSAIASLINYAFVSTNGVKSGLVNVRQNLKVLTENDLYSKNVYQFDLTSGTNVLLPISFDIADANTYDFNYTISNTSLSYLSSRKCLISATTTSNISVYADASINSSAVTFNLIPEVLSNRLLLKYTSNNTVVLQLSLNNKFKSYI